MTTEELIRLLVALFGGGGLAAGLTAAISALRAVRSGVSALNGRRKVDLAMQRDIAEARAEWAEGNLETYRSNEQRAREHAAELRIMLMEKAQLSREEMPPWPTMEETVPRSKLLEILREQAKQEVKP